MEPIKVAYISPFLPTKLNVYGKWVGITAHALDQWFLHQGAIQPIDYLDFLVKAGDAGLSVTRVRSALFTLRDVGFISIVREDEVIKIVPYNWQPERFQSPAQQTTSE